mmetsp:Transcript_28912/g.84397  ORF Transcript_28912/g.84397 Transcript_28912/m.84397 type:complete len:283 (-) Transcript_28912:1343-2191(-)
MAEPSTANFDILREAEVLDLVQHELRVREVGSFRGVWLDAANVVRLALLQCGHELRDLALELGGNTGRSFRLLLLRTLVVEEIPHQRHAGLGKGLDQVKEQGVQILLHKAFVLVDHVSSVVPHRECRVAMDAIKHEVGVRGNPLHRRGKLGFGSVLEHACLVQHVEDSLGLCFDQVADRLVVEVFHLDPADALTEVLSLLSPQGERDEVLLQFFVAIVDAELLETVHLENFKPVNVQEAEGEAACRSVHLVATRVSPCILGIDSAVKAVHDPVEEALVRLLR